MPALAIGGSAVSVLNARMRREALSVPERMQSGNLVGARPSGAADRDVWEVEAGVLTAAGATSLIATLTAPGTVTASGDIIGGSITARAEGVRSRRGSLESHVLVTFLLVEVP